MATNKNILNLSLSAMKIALQQWMGSHKHDGNDSTLITAGSAPAAGALAATTEGRAIMANNYFDATTAKAKVADNALDNAFCDAKFAANAFADDADSRAIFKDGIWTLAKLAETARTHILSYQVEDLNAGDDIVERVIFEAPTGIDVTLVSANIIPQGNADGIDDSNKCVVKLSDGTNTIVEATYGGASSPFPAAAAAASLGTLDTTHKALAAGKKLYLSVTNGATADPPGFMLQVVYTVADAQ